jgi:hypothetical protein
MQVSLSHFDNFEVVVTIVSVGSLFMLKKLRNEAFSTEGRERALKIWDLNMSHSCTRFV